MNELTLIGHVGATRLAQAGETPVLNVSLATSRRIGEREYTDWTSVKVWGERANKLNDHITKGARLMVRGRPEARGYQKGDGTIAGELVLHLTELEFLSAKSKSSDDQLGLEAGKSKRRKAAAAA